MPVASHQETYPLFLEAGGRAEQRADDWWGALRAVTPVLLAEAGVAAEAVSGIAFCSQMQGTVLVDREGRALRNPMAYMDTRAQAEFEAVVQRGFPRIQGMNAWKVLRSLWVAGGMAATAKDPLWKYHWVRNHEPDIFRQVYKWLDVKDYLLLRCTGEAAMTGDSAHLTFVYDTRAGRGGWSEELCRMFGIDMAHLPRVVVSTDVVGGLTAQAAADLGLREDTPVFGGGGDASLIPLGAGCCEPNDTHIYVGTSGWVTADVAKRMVDLEHFIAAIQGAIPGRYNYIAEQETSGVCLQWARDHLVRDDGMGACEAAAGEDLASLYPLMSQRAAEVAPGAGGVLFTPWMHGNRAPREDPWARGVFFNVGLDTDKRTLVRAVLEGVAYNKRWLLEAVERRVPRQDTVRFVGGGARSEQWCQILADVTGRTIETTAHPQDAGVRGAAVVAAVGLGLLDSFAEAKRLVPVDRTYTPDRAHRPVYEHGFRIFQALYERNRPLFRRANEQS